MARQRRPGPGLARATRAPLLRHRQGYALSREAEELIFQHAEMLSEGAVEARGVGSTYFGSTMITVDLGLVARGLRGADITTLADAVEGSMRVRLRAMRWATAEAQRRVPELSFETAQVETSMRVVDQKLHVDVDLEMPVELSSEHHGT